MRIEAYHTNDQFPFNTEYYPMPIVPSVDHEVKEITKLPSNPLYSLTKHSATFTAAPKNCSSGSRKRPIKIMTFSSSPSNRSLKFASDGSTGSVRTLSGIQVRRLFESLRNENYTHVVNVPASIENICFFSRMYDLVPIDDRFAKFVSDTYIASFETNACLFAKRT